MKCDLPWHMIVTLSLTFLQLFCGLPATSAGPMTHPSAAGLQTTLGRGGRSSPAAHPRSTQGLTWTTQVRTENVWPAAVRAGHIHFKPSVFVLSVIQVILSNRRIREFHLHLSDGSARGGSAGQPRRQLPGFRSVRVILVPHVRVAHRHIAYKTAQTDGWWTSWHPAVDGQWTPGQPLEGRSCPSAAHQQTLSGESKLTHLSLRISGLYPSVVSKKRLPVSHSVLFLGGFQGGDRRPGGWKELGRHRSGWH